MFRVTNAASITSIVLVAEAALVTFAADGFAIRTEPSPLSVTVTPFKPFASIAALIWAATPAVSSTAESVVSIVTSTFSPSTSTERTSP